MKIGRLYKLDIISIRKNAIEFGYLFVGWINDNQNNWFNQHYLQTTWVIKLNFNKHKNN